MCCPLRRIVKPQYLKLVAISLEICQKTESNLPDLIAIYPPPHFGRSTEVDCWLLVASKTFIIQLVQILPRYPPNAPCFAGPTAASTGLPTWRSGAHQPKSSDSCAGIGAHSANFTDNKNIMYYNVV